MSMDQKGYESLAQVLQAAYDQAAKGKGAERHATGLPFDQQPMQTGSDLLGTDVGLAFQAIKKIREGSSFTEYDRFERELLGAINYIAGMIIWRKRQQTAQGFSFSVEPATQIDDESDRQKAVEQNGNDGAVYDDPWYDAPEWAKYKAQDEDGEWRWYSHAPRADDERWLGLALLGRAAHAGISNPNPNWRDTLISR